MLYGNDNIKSKDKCKSVNASQHRLDVCEIVYFILE